MQYAKLRAALATNPQIEAILLNDTSLEEKRLALRAHLSNLLITVFDRAENLPSMEWILCRDAIWAFRNLLSPRSEDLAGYSFLEYLVAVLKASDRGQKPKPPSPGFIAEVEHLIRGISGTAKVYTEKAPTFLKYSGRKAARLRSIDLSRMARTAARKIAAYPCGLDDHLRRERSTAKLAIQRSFNITDLEWNDWKWHTRHIIRDADTLRNLITLDDDEYEAVRLARLHRIPFGITPYYLSLFDPANSKTYDTAIRAQVIPPLDYVRKMQRNRQGDDCVNDFMSEQDTSPIDGITRRYPNIVIIKPVLTCPQICVYCQRNWQIEDVYSESAILSPESQEKALAWIENTPEINEVLITGGDPFLLPDPLIEQLMARVATIKHVHRIRLGTRTPVTLPQRITESLARAVTRFHEPGRREVMVVTHFEHVAEITPEAMAAVQRFRLFGVEVYNQLVYTFFNSRRFETAALRQKLRLIGVTPYYTFNTKGKEETDAYRVPIPRLLQEQDEEARLLPGTVRTDEIVFNVPRLGKNYLKASQHRDLISILPDGRRVYEFHPWEKKLALMDTYVYTDVSIYEYLKRLKQVGENINEYRTIWYYY
jgi:lysine 2,3-aminomutase